MKKLSTILAVAAMTAVSTVAQAQPVVSPATCGPDGSGNLAINAPVCAQTHILSTTVNDILMLSVNTGSTGLGNPKAVNYGPQATYTSSATPLASAAGPNVKVVANRAFDVSITAPANFTTNNGVANKPSSDVRWSKGAAFTALSTTATSVFSDTQGTADTNKDLSFDSIWQFERDKPGNYSLTVTLTLAAK